LELLADFGFDVPVVGVEFFQFAGEGVDVLILKLGFAKWKVADPMQVFSGISNDLVKTLLACAEEYGRKPNAVGKSLLCWKSLYDTVEVGLLRAQAAKA
jgi:hypothetical protein